MRAYLLHAQFLFRREMLFRHCGLLVQIIERPVPTTLYPGEYGALSTGRPMLPMAPMAVNSTVTSQYKVVESENGIINIGIINILPAR